MGLWDEKPSQDLLGGMGGGSPKDHIGSVGGGALQVHLLSAESRTSLGVGGWSPQDYPEGSGARTPLKIILGFWEAEPPGSSCGQRLRDARAVLLLLTTLRHRRVCQNNVHRGSLQHQVRRAQKFEGRVSRRGSGHKCGNLQPIWLPTGLWLPLGNTRGWIAENFHSRHLVSVFLC